MLEDESEGRDAEAARAADSDPLNPRLTVPEIGLLTGFAGRRRLADGETLFAAGEGGGGFFVVLAGRVRVVDRSGSDVRVVAEHGPGQFTGDIDILARRRPVVSAVAQGDTEVLEVAASDLRRIISEQPQMGEKLLRAFIMRREALLESGLEGLRVIGSNRSEGAFRIREFLMRNRIPFTWLDVDEEPEILGLLGRFGVAEEDLPVVAAGDHPLLLDPSPREVAEALGLRRRAGPQLHDLMVIGAGPAGLAAAVYAASEGLDTVVLEATAPGGQAGASTRIENYLGFPMGISGAELTSHAALQAQKFGAELMSPARVVELDLEQAHPVARLDSGERVRSISVLIATGADYRILDVPGCDRLGRPGVYYAATPVEAQAVEGSDVVVVGGGNSAGQAIVYLAGHTRTVRVLLRGDDLRAHMSSYLADRVEQAANVEVLPGTEVRELLGEERLERVLVEHTASGQRRTIEASAVFSFIGATPCSTWIPACIERDPEGFVRTGRAVAGSPTWTLAREPFFLETSRAGVFAAGDVREGSVARVSSAVGEGAMAVKFVHEYLAEVGEQPTAASRQAAGRATDS